MRSPVPTGIVLISSLLCGCTSLADKPGDASQPTQPEPARAVEREPDVANASPPEPPPPVDARLESPELRAGEGFEIGPPLKARRGTSWVQAAAPLRYDAATVSVASDQVQSDDNDESRLSVHVRIEFDDDNDVDPKLGLNSRRDVTSDRCDEINTELQDLAKLTDGRWLVDAQMACRSGADYFEAENVHTLILIEPSAKTASVLWTGVDAGSNAMDVCVSMSLHSFEVVGDEVIVRRTAFTVLDKQAAKHTPGAAQGCKPKRETVEVVARIRLARGK